MRTTIEMAREAAGDDWGLFQEYMPEIHRLAALVRADERARMAEQPAQQKPEYAWPTVTDYERDVGFETNEAFRMAWNMARTTNKMLGHTSPPAQRTWVGLSDDEMWTLWNAEGNDAMNQQEAIAFAKSTEAKLKEKNT